jgi:peptide deformylase
MDAPIILYGSSVLRKHTSEITKEDIVCKIAGMLSDTLKKAGWTGLAGPQIAPLKRTKLKDQGDL